MNMWIIWSALQNLICGRRLHSGTSLLPEQTTVGLLPINTAYTILVHSYAKEGIGVEQKLRNKLSEASQVYRKTISWLSMQASIILAHIHGAFWNGTKVLVRV
jgi:hypothetical protein